MDGVSVGGLVWVCWWVWVVGKGKACHAAWGKRNVPLEISRPCPTSPLAGGTRGPCAVSGKDHVEGFGH